jgi:hypothetical protein
VAMQPTVRKAQVGPLFLGLGLGSIRSESNSNSALSFHLIFFAFDSQTLDLHPRLANDTIVRFYGSTRVDQGTKTLYIWVYTSVLVHVLLEI